MLGAQYIKEERHATPLVQKGMPRSCKFKPRQSKVSHLFRLDETTDDNFKTLHENVVMENSQQVVSGPVPEKETPRSRAAYKIRAAGKLSSSPCRKCTNVDAECWVSAAYKRCARCTMTKKGHDNCNAAGTRESVSRSLCKFRLWRL